MSINTILVSSHGYLLNEAEKVLSQLNQIRIIYSNKNSLLVLDEITKGQANLIVIVDKPKNETLGSFILKVMEIKPIPCLVLLSSQDSAEIYKEYIDISLVDTIELDTKDPFFVKILSIRVNILSKLKVDKFIGQINRLSKLVREKNQTISEENDSIIEDPTSREKLTNGGERDSVSEKEISSTKSKQGPVDISQITIDYSKLIVIGASTGGPRALTELLSSLPNKFPPILLVQHMPRGFVPSFADRLNHFCKLDVRVAIDGDLVKRNTIYVAQGGRHLELDKIGKNNIKIKISDGPLVNFVKPSVDVTLFAAARVYGHRVVSVILTGMGNDGREGSRVVKKMGGTVIAQSAEGSVVYGMNKAVIESNLADHVAELGQISRLITSTVTKY